MLAMLVIRQNVLSFASLIIINYSTVSRNRPANELGLIALIFRGHFEESVTT